MIQVDGGLAAMVVQAGLFAADEEALAPPQWDDTPATVRGRVVEAAVMHLLEQGLLVLAPDARERLAAGVPAFRQQR